MGNRIDSVHVHLPLTALAAARVVLAGVTLVRALMDAEDPQSATQDVLAALAQGQAPLRRSASPGSCPPG